MSPQSQPPFWAWDFVQPLDPNRAPGHGVDHHDTPPLPPMPASFPFDGPGQQGPPAGPWGPGSQWSVWFNDAGHGPWGGRGGHHRHHGRHGHRHHHRDGDVNMEDEHREGDSTNEKEESPETMRGEVPDPAEVAPGDDEANPPPYANGPFRRGVGGRSSRGGCRRGSGRFGGRHEHHGGPPPPRSFDFPGMMRGFMGHPFFRNLGDQAARYYSPENNQPNNNNNNNNDDDDDDDDADSFEPPVDIFNTERAFVLHVALPGAKKEDVGVNWIPETSVLSIAGVVHRPGHEEFLRALTSGERRVGLFGRKITLPPAGASGKEDVDGFGITAKMENGILVITVPKVEREWTEVRKVDIE